MKVRTNAANRVQPLEGISRDRLAEKKNPVSEDGSSLLDFASNDEKAHLLRGKNYPKGKDYIAGGKNVLLVLPFVGQEDL